jgi:hypothetical protein
MDADADILQLKELLREMEKSRVQKNLALRRRNEIMAARDAQRHARFLAEFKTEEQIAAERAAEEVRRLQAAMSDRIVEEDDARAALEEEEALESRIMMQQLRLDLIGSTFRFVNAVYDRVAHQRVAQEEAKRRRIASFQKLLEAVAAAEAEDRRKIVKGADQDLRVMLSLKQKDREKCDRMVAERGRLDAVNAQEQGHRDDEADAVSLLRAEEEQCELRFQSKLSSIAGSMAFNLQRLERTIQRHVVSNLLDDVIPCRTTSVWIDGADSESFDGRSEDSGRLNSEASLVIRETIAEALLRAIGNNPCGGISDAVL